MTTNNPIIVDFETRSRCDLKACGHSVYTKHESTDILCVSFYDLISTESIVIDPENTELPWEWRKKIENALVVMAHNAPFDRGIWDIAVDAYGFPVVPFEKWYCTSAQMRVNAMPAGLDNAALALGVKNRKSFAGTHLIKKLSIPDKETGKFNECKIAMAEMRHYCLQDVIVTADIVRATRLMTDQEHSDWLLNERINERGIGVDVEMAEYAQSYAVEEKELIATEMVQLSQGEITAPTQTKRIKDYVLARLDVDEFEGDLTLQNLMTKEDGKFTLDANTREQAIELLDKGEIDLEPEIEGLIRLLHSASASSVAKFKKMQTMAGKFDRVRGAFIYYGASQTGRFSSLGLQMHNMKRDCLTEEEYYDLKSEMKQGIKIPHLMKTLSKALRPNIMPFIQYTFVVGDYSSVEARALPWLSNDPRAERKLELFRRGVDVYIVTSDEMGLGNRQVGKVAELSLGYGGALGAFSAMAKVYGVELPDYEVTRIVKSWRAKNAWCVDFWKSVEHAMLKAMRSRKGDVYTAGRLTYHFDRKLMGGTLICTLPDGATIQYPKAKIVQGRYDSQIECLKASKNPKKDDNGKWGTIRLWGGMAVENACQAFCASLLRIALRNADNSELDIVGHVHDEIIVECNDTAEAETIAKLQVAMESANKDFKGLPLKAVPVAMGRYGNH